MDINDAFNMESILLEPRLQEYIEKKKFNEENDIIPEISVEKEFCISPNDRRVIRRYMKGKKIYSRNRINKDHFIEPDIGDFESLHDFKQDPRYKRLERKMESHKKAQESIRNFSHMDSEYDFPKEQSQKRNTKKISQKNDKNEMMRMRTMKPFDDPSNDILSEYVIDPTIMLDSRDLVISSSRPYGKNKKSKSKYCYNVNESSNNPNIYNHPPRISYNNYLSHQEVNGGMRHLHDVDNVIGNIDGSFDRFDRTYQKNEYSQGYGDHDTKRYIPGVRTGTQRERENQYRSVPFMYGNGLPNVSVEDSLRGGFDDSSKKSIGFRNPFENQFSYISNDISDPNHTVTKWPENSRGYNHEIARPKYKS
jgi:hypothetical protein